MSQWGNRGIGSPAGGRLPFILRSFDRPQPQGPLPKSRTTEQSHDFDRTYKAGYRDASDLWSGCFVFISGSAHRPGVRRGWSFPNHVEGIAELAAFCREHQVELVTMEATDGYEQQALRNCPKPV